MIFVACTLTQKGKRKQAERRASAKCMQSPAYALHSAPLCFLPSVCVCQETTSSKSVWVIVRSQRRTRWAQLVGTLAHWCGDGGHGHLSDANAQMPLAAVE